MFPSLIWYFPSSSKHQFATLAHKIQDEVFHIPQAQAYCRWDYATWDPKLTTPPGLYVLFRQHIMMRITNRISDIGGVIS